MHMVHINTAYDTFAEAKAAADGLAVLGFFMNIENVPFPFKVKKKHLKKCIYSIPSFKIVHGQSIQKNPERRYFHPS